MGEQAVMSQPMLKALSDIYLGLKMCKVDLTKYVLKLLWCLSFSELLSNLHAFFK